MAQKMGRIITISLLQLLRDMVEGYLKASFVCVFREIVSSGFSSEYKTANPHQAQDRGMIDNDFAQELFSVNVAFRDEPAFFQTAVNLEKAFQSVFSHMAKDTEYTRDKLLHTVERIIVEARLDTGIYLDKTKKKACLVAK